MYEFDTCLFFRCSTSIMHSFNKYLLSSNYVPDPELLFNIWFIYTTFRKWSTGVVAMPSEQGFSLWLLNLFPNDSCPQQGPQSLLKDDMLEKFLPTFPSEGVMPKLQCNFFPEKGTGPCVRWEGSPPRVWWPGSCPVLVWPQSTWELGFLPSSDVSLYLWLEFQEWEATWNKRKVQERGKESPPPPKAHCLETRFHLCFSS